MWVSRQFTEGIQARIVEHSVSLLLVLCAFWLGACPFSLWIGKCFLGKDIRDYGDGNPGAFNVFRAGGRKSGLLAIVLDVGKGIPFVFIASSLLELREVTVLAIGLSAILGSAFSPVLHFKGGKSLAVTFGVLITLPQHELLISFALFLLLGFLLIDVHAWIVMLGATGSLAYSVITPGISWDWLLMACILAILATKHFDDLHSIPTLNGKLIAWLRSKRSGKTKPSI